MRLVNKFVAACVSAAIGICAASDGASAEEYKYKNAEPKFKPASKDAEMAAAARKLGDPPKLTEKQQTEVDEGEVVIREVKGGGEGKRYEAIAVVKAPPKAVMAFLRDFKAFVGPMPNLKKIEFTWDGNVAHVTQWLKVAITTVSYRLNIAHYGDSVIEWEFVEGDIKDTTGYYKFFPRAEGRETLLVYHVYTDPGMAVPQFIINLLTKSSMPGVIEAIRTAVAKRAGK
ncbi:MAG: hypothetical protein HY897_08540 [Deltaproteobacteria bacterium]|nr:hypothetical protein [Deltaproteobacteria bacterium]